jgi:hypothetical protein
MNSVSTLAVMESRQAGVSCTTYSVGLYTVAKEFGYFLLQTNGRGMDQFIRVIYKTFDLA